MKKSYIAPSVKVVKVNSQNILAGSVNTPKNEVGNKSQLGKQNVDDEWEE